MDIIFILMSCLFATYSVVKSDDLGILHKRPMGTFFWRPRLGLDLTIPTTEAVDRAHKLSKENIAKGLVVALDGYQAGVTVIALAAGLSSGQTYPHHNPLSAYFYTNVYRWGLRYLSLLPLWLNGHNGHFCKTLKVWRRRFYYGDKFVPKWLRYFLPYVKKEEWEKEEKEFMLFKKYSESAFGRHYRYPSRIFNDYRSEETKETLENSNIDSYS